MTDAADALERSLVRADRSGRARVFIQGPDRASMLHNLSTNAVNGRSVGTGSEAFITSPQGRTIGLVTLLILDDAILLRTEVESVGAVLSHLRKYGAFDDVALDDAAPRTFEHHLAGPVVSEVLKALGCTDLPDSDLAHGSIVLGGTTVRVVRETPLAAPGVTLIGDVDSEEAVKGVVDGVGPIDLTAESFEALRIEAGTPASGREATEKNLPQELGRDDRAISFTKGCYLGQETVARLDALGHVNRLLRGLDIDAEAPPEAGARLFDASTGKEVGWITSAARSERTGSPIALGFVRTSHAMPGTRVEVLIDGHDGISATIRTPPDRGSSR